MATNLTTQEHFALAHWSTYGQPGSSPEKRVTASEWKTHPFQKPVTSSWSVPIQPSQLSTLLNGFWPRELADKWFVYADGHDAEGHAVLHLHRSWTGMKIAEVAIEICVAGSESAPEGPARITGIIWESSEEVIKRQDERGAKETVSEVCRWVLNVERPDDGAQ